MRTTLTLDDDVSKLLLRICESRKASLKSVVNEALRQGLWQMTSSPPRRKTYRIKPVSLGRCLIGDIDNVAEALAIAEGEDHH